jgi:molybdopterin-guanine dinucleotide biosynthesis protein A
VTDHHEPVPGSGRPLAGLVLCGGAGTRMGKDKALIEIDGVPLVEVVASRLRRIADPILLASGAPGRCAHLPSAEGGDDPRDAGPIGGLLAGLAESPHDLVAVAGVDMPFVSPELFLLLADLREAEDAVVPVSPSGVEPLHAIYAKAATPGLRRAVMEGRAALRAALEGLRVRLVEAGEWTNADPSGRFAFNVNRPEDLAGLI